MPLLFKKEKRGIREIGWWGGWLVNLGGHSTDLGFLPFYYFSFLSLPPKMQVGEGITSSVQKFKILEKKNH